MFGFTEEQIAWFGMTVGVGAFMLYMVFIVAQLAWESKAGKFGTFILFLALAFGMLGFASKGVIEWIFSKKVEQRQATEEKRPEPPRPATAASANR
jgi:hypothetical protein